MTHEQYLIEKLKNDPEALKRLEAFKQEIWDAGLSAGYDNGKHNTKTQILEALEGNKCGGCSHEPQTA